MAVDSILQQVDGMLKQGLEYATQYLRELCEDQQTTDIVGKFKEQCDKWSSSFDNLMSSYKQEQYFKENFNFIEPKPISIGESCKMIGHGNKRFAGVKSHYLYYISLSQTIAALCKKTRLLEIIQTKDSRKGNSEEMIFDFEDGLLSQTHPLFQDKHVFRIVLYYDDVEICNPLGSKSNKLGLFYFTILNIPYKYRARMQSIFLIAVANTDDIKQFGIDKVLEPIVAELNTFSSTGFDISLNDSKITVKGCLAALVADTLAAHQLTGFKEGVGFSYQKCRTCLCTFAEMNEKFMESDFEMRNIQTHIQVHCQNIQETTVLTGVNRKSHILDVKYFNIFCSTPHDIMHIVLEGCLPYTIKMILQYFVKLKILTVNQINESIQYFEYSYIDYPTKPSTLTKAQLFGPGKFRQSASQMWTLARLLPLFLFSHVDISDPVYTCFATLLEITSTLFSPAICKSTVALLDLQIGHYLQMFKKCFSEKNIIPKQHYLIHLPGSILQLGPIVHFWTMRFEAKHSYFKKLANIANYKNLGKYMATRHQKHFCMELLDGKMFANTCQHGRVQTVSEDLNHKLSEKGYFVATLNAKCCNWFMQNGQKFKKKCFVQISVEKDMPLFAQVDEILLTASKVLLLVNCFETCGLNSSLNAYVLRAKNSYTFVEFTKLLWHEPLSAYAGIITPFWALPIKTNFQ